MFTAVILLIFLVNGSWSFQGCAFRFRQQHMKPVLKSSGSDGNSPAFADMKSIKEEVSDFVNKCLLESLDPTELVDKAHILTQKRFYEEVMDTKRKTCATDDELAKLEQLDSALRGFITSERKSRSRLKVNYLMAGASSNRLEDAIQMLSQSGELDEDLVSFLEGLVQKELVRARGPTASTEDEKQLQGPAKLTVEVLRMIQRRLESEIRTQGRQDMQLLRTLLSENDVEARERTIMTELTTLEGILAFNDFIASAIEYIHSDRGSNRKESERKPIEIPVSTIAKLQDIKYSLEKLVNMLKTGLVDENVFSTTPDDYVPSLLKKRSGEAGENASIG